MAGAAVAMTVSGTPDASWTPCAVKEVVLSGGTVPSTRWKETVREVLLLQEFSGHPHIVTLLGVVFYTKLEADVHCEKVLIMLQLVEGVVCTRLHEVPNKDLAAWLCSRVTVASQIVALIEHLHSHGIVHGGLELSSFLLCGCEVMLAGFGGISEIETQAGRASVRTLASLALHPTPHAPCLQLPPACHTMQL